MSLDTDDTFEVHSLDPRARLLSQLFASVVNAREHNQVVAHLIEAVTDGAQLPVVGRLLALLVQVYELAVRAHHGRVLGVEAVAYMRGH